MSDSMTPIQLDDAERTRCEIWSRCMGYHRPVSFWNPGKQQEHRDRLNFREDGSLPDADRGDSQ